MTDASWAFRGLVGFGHRTSADSANAIGVGWRSRSPSPPCDRRTELTFARVVLGLSAIPFAFVGVAFLVRPIEMGALVGIEVAGPTAEADVRAVYGGLQLGCAAFLALAASREGWQRPGLAAQLSLYAGLASSRLLSYGLAGLPSALGLALHAGEVAGVVLGALAWLSLRGHRTPSA